MESLSRLVSVGGEGKDGCGHSCSPLLGGMSSRVNISISPKMDQSWGSASPWGIFVRQKRDSELKGVQQEREGYTESNRDGELVQNILCS